MKVTVVISYYKNLDNLKLILEGLKNQSNKNFEVIVSEDDNNNDTVLFLNEERKKYTFSIIHLTQNEDLGFRKNIMLNKSIKASNGEILVFIDGDCIPHRHLVKCYTENISENYLLKGRRVMLGEKISNKLLHKKSIKGLNLLKIILSDSKKKKEAFYTYSLSLTVNHDSKGLLGCNFGILKKHLLEINGFDEDYVRASVGEDTDLEWRLKGIGIKSKIVKNMAIVYHIYHKNGYSKEDLNANNIILDKKLLKKKYYCTNGLNK